MIEAVARELNTIYKNYITYTPARAYCEPTVIIEGYSIAPPRGIKDPLPFVGWYLKWRLRDNIKHSYVKEGER